MSSVRRLVTLALAGLVAFVPFAPVAAADAVDPDAALVTAAKREGSVVLYGSMTAGQMAPFVARFQATYGIRVETLRMESNVIPSRMMIEARAGASKADVVDVPGFQMDLLKREHLLETVAVPETASMRPGTFDRDGTWKALFLNTETIAYNPKALAAAHLAPPKTWSDFTKPEWRGRFALFSGSYAWYAAMLHAFGKEKGEALARALAANGAKMVNSHQLAENLLVAGEYVGAVNTYGYDVVREQRDGGAVNVNPDPTVVEIHAIAVAAKGPHPNAARLFLRWALGRDDQSWIAATLGRVSARTDVKNDPAIWNTHVHYVYSDPADSVEYADYAKAFNAIFGVAG